jgi:hypothetical protein
MATFQDIQNINISNDPITGLQRQVTVESFYCSMTQQFFRLDCTVYRLKDGINVNSETLPVYVRTLTADDTDMVDANGNLVASDDPNAVTGQFTFFKLAAANPLQLYDIFLNKVQAADLLAKFN